MGMTQVTKRTYTLPGATVDAFERVVPAGQRSRRLAEVLDEWISEQQRTALREAVITGCLDMADVLRETEAEYHPLEEEVDRVIQGSDSTR
jgi:hypothetical protein